jgi:hypothetical protein
MKFKQYGIIKYNSNINSLVDLLLSIDGSQKYEYMGMIVEIDPSVDFNNHNVLIRWTDTVEGFNDKIIVKSKSEFLKLFTLKK